MEDFAHIHDVIGQLPFLKSYTHFLLCFPLRNGLTKDSIVANLETATSKLVETFPWLAGKVINEGSGPGDSGLFRVVPCQKFAWRQSILKVKDCTDLCPSFTDISKAQGPFSMLDGQVLASLPAFPQSYEDSESDPAPVVLLQANFVQGGLLLDICAQHNFMDGGGLLHLLGLLATALRGEDFSRLVIEQGNRDRRNIIPLLRADEPMLDHSHFRRTRPDPSIPKPARDPSPWWAFRFPASKLAGLKALASPPKGSNPAVPFVTTNDALSAFCWQRVTAVRLGRDPSLDGAMSRFCRAADARRPMGVPSQYMGHMVHVATTTLSMKEIEQGPLFTVAAALRKSLNDVNDAYGVRSFVTLIANTPDKATIGYTGTFNLDTDIGSSSMAHSDIWNAEFGVLGKPDLVRRPNFPPLESDIYFWPHSPAGDIDALLCFNEDVLNDLKVDPEWNSYVEYIG